MAKHKIPETTYIETIPQVREMHKDAQAEGYSDVAAGLHSLIVFEEYRDFKDTEHRLPWLCACATSLDNLDKQEPWNDEDRELKRNALSAYNPEKPDKKLINFVKRRNRYA